MWRYLSEFELDLRLGGCLQGPPGCGKSSLVATHIARAWRDAKLHTLVVSPNVLAKGAFAKNLHRQAPVEWHHLVLREFRARLRNGDLYPFDLLVVDEFTWLTKEDLLAVADLHQPKLFVGDLQQLKAYPNVGQWPLFARLCRNRMHWMSAPRVSRFDTATAACLAHLQKHRKLPPWASYKRAAPGGTRLHALKAGEYQGGSIRHPFTIVGLHDPGVTLEHMYVAISRGTRWSNIHFQYTDRVFPRQT